MLNNNYLYNNYALVIDNGDFFTAPLPEIPKIKSLIGAIKVLFSLPESNVRIYCAEGERVYKIELLTKDVHKLSFGTIYYLPLLRRLDLYVAEEPYMPFIQWKEKKVVFKNYSRLLDLANVDNLFKTLINTTL